MKTFFSKLNLEDINLDDFKQPNYMPRDPYHGERLLQQIKDAELKKAEAQKKANRRKVLFIALLVIGGYFAFKKFKK